MYGKTHVARSEPRSKGMFAFTDFAARFIVTHCARYILYKFLLPGLIVLFPCKRKPFRLTFFTYLVYKRNEFFYQFIEKAVVIGLSVTA